MKTMFKQVKPAWFLLTAALTLSPLIAWSQALPPDAPAAKPATPPPAPAALQLPIPGAPKIQFDKTVYDFGKTSQVSQVAGTFKIKNMGEGVLKLQKPVTSCGCTVASLKNDTLQSGDECELNFTLNVGPGKAVLHKTITVNCNDPQTPTTVLNLVVDYTPVFEVIPQMLSLQNLRMGATTNAYLQAKRLDGKKLVITKLVTTDPWLKAKLESMDQADGTSGKIALEVTPQGTPRRFYDRVVVQGEGGVEVGSFYVSGNGVGDVSIMPEQIHWWLTATAINNFPAAATNQVISNQFTRRIMVNSTVPGRPLFISNITSTIPTIKTEAIRRPNQSGYDLIARLTEPPKTNLTGSISFETSLPSQPKVTVPITLQVWNAQAAAARPGFPPPAARINIRK